MSQTHYQVSLLSRVSFILLFFLPGILIAGSGSDTAAIVVIRMIDLAGNKLTRPQIILRELPFQENDTVILSTLPGLLKEAKENVFNTQLFNFVTVDTVVTGREPLKINVRIHVI